MPPAEDRPRPPVRAAPRRGFGFGFGVSLAVHGLLFAALIGVAAGVAAPPRPLEPFVASLDGRVALEPDLDPAPSALPELPTRLRPETMLDPIDAGGPPDSPFPEETVAQRARSLPEPGLSFERRPTRLMPSAGGRTGGAGTGTGVGDGAGGPSGEGPASGGGGVAREPVFVSARPLASDCRRPEYPRSAREGRLEGSVRLRLVVSEEGSVLSVAIEVPSGHDALDTAAADAARGWRFEPATEDGAPVTSTVLVPVSFRLSGEGKR